MQTYPKPYVVALCVLVFLAVAVLICVVAMVPLTN